MRLAVLVVLLAAGAPAQVVISQVYGGGGNAGATYRNDFVELFNRSAAAVDVTGWSVQYASSTGSAWQVTVLSGSVPGNSYFLIEESAGAGGTAGLPRPDVAGGTIAMSATAGKVALAKGTEALSGACPGGEGVLDLVGYGSGTNCSKTAPTATLSNTTAAVRTNECADSRDNSSDFRVMAPAPRNSSSPGRACGDGGSSTLRLTPAPLPPGFVYVPYSQPIVAVNGVECRFTTGGDALPGGFALNAGEKADTVLLAGVSAVPVAARFMVTATCANGTVSETYTLAIAVPACAVTHTISQVQGSGIASPVAGRMVTTRGIVTGTKQNGFFLQASAEDDDGDWQTSEGVFVFTNERPEAAFPSKVAAGNLVCVTGVVAEFAPDTDPGPTITEITTAGLPQTTVGLLAIEQALPAVTEIDAPAPEGDAYQWERYEGMRVRLRGALTVTGPTSEGFSETTLARTFVGRFLGVAGAPRPYREPGVQQPDPVPQGAPPNVPRWDSNPEVIGVDTGQPGGAALPVSPGQVVANVQGPLDFVNRVYTIITEAGAKPEVAGAPLMAKPVPEPAAGEFTIANFNLQRFFDADPATAPTDVTLSAAAYEARLRKASLAIRNIARMPDILGVEEVDNEGTLRTLAERINQDAVAAGQPNPRYAVSAAPVTNDPGGIRVGFLYKADRVVNPTFNQFGVADQYSGAPLNDRPPYLLECGVRASNGDAVAVSVLVNHLRSLNGITRRDAEGDRVRNKRCAQAEFTAGLIQEWQRRNPAGNLAVIGDFNSFEFSDGYVDVMGKVRGDQAPEDQVVVYRCAGYADTVAVTPALTELMNSLPPEQRYTYSFNGSLQALDHILANQNLATRLSRFAIAHVNAEFTDDLRRETARPERVSDHDIPVAYFTLAPGGNVQPRAAASARAR